MSDPNQQTGAGDAPDETTRRTLRDRIGLGRRRAARDDAGGQGAADAAWSIGGDRTAVLPAVEQETGDDGRVEAAASRAGWNAKERPLLDGEAGEEAEERRRQASGDFSHDFLQLTDRSSSHAAGLKAKQITAWFGDHKVLDRVSLTMPAGQVTALIGPSGCGKSTFLRILNRMHELVPSARLAGEVLLDDTDIYGREQRVTDARRKIGMVFQKANPFPAMSIYENTVAGLALCGLRVSKEEKDYIVEDALEKASLWDEVKDRLHQPGGGLSGGQQQRLCIARSLAVSPEVLLMDEPCSALDPTSTRRVEETIAELRGRVTVVIVTHNMQQAARVSDHCAFFLATQNTPGVIVEYGDTTAMFNNPQDARTLDYVNGRFG